MLGDSDKEGCLTFIIAMIALATLGAVFAWINAYNESATYNRLTGAHTTTWDALWVELRVQDSPKGE